MQKTALDLGGAEIPKALARWLEVAKNKDFDGLKDLLAEDCIFISPVVFRPQIGREVSFKYLAGALFVLGGPGFRYVDQWITEKSAVLEFSVEINGVEINGADFIHWNDADRIARFKVMVRPLKAINLLHQLMGARLAAS